MYIWVTEVYNHHFIYSVEFKAFIRSADTKEDGCCDRLALTSTALTGFFAKYLGKVMSKGPWRNPFPKRGRRQGSRMRKYLYYIES